MTKKKKRRRRERTKGLIFGKGLAKKEKHNIHS
jgi:hypothetical protein